MSLQQMFLTFVSQILESTTLNLVYTIIFLFSAAKAEPMFQEIMCEKSWVISQLALNIYYTSSSLSAPHLALLFSPKAQVCLWYTWKLLYICFLTGGYTIKKISDIIPPSH